MDMSQKFGRFLPKSKLGKIVVSPVYLLVVGLLTLVKLVIAFVFGGPKDKSGDNINISSIFWRTTLVLAASIMLFSIFTTDDTKRLRELAIIQEQRERLREESGRNFLRNSLRGAGAVWDGDVRGALESTAEYLDSQNEINDRDKQLRKRQEYIESR